MRNIKPSKAFVIIDLNFFYISILYIKMRTPSVVVLSLFVLFFSTKLLAGEEDVYNVIEPSGMFMIGVEPELDFDPNSATTYFHFDISATKKMDVNLKYGVTTGTKPYYGAHLEYHFIDSAPLGFAVSFGGHYRNGVILDLTPVFIHKLGKYTFAAGPEFNWKITNNKEFEADFFIGASMPLPHSMEISLNVGFPIKNDTYWISSGLSYYY